jgi:hypothetical protein
LFLFEAVNFLPLFVCHDKFECLLRCCILVVFCKQNTRKAHVAVVLKETHPIPLHVYNPFQWHFRSRLPGNEARPDDVSAAVLPSKA